MPHKHRGLVFGSGVAAAVPPAVLLLHPAVAVGGVFGSGRAGLGVSSGRASVAFGSGGAARWEGGGEETRRDGREGEPGRDWMRGDERCLVFSS